MLSFDSSIQKLTDLKTQSSSGSWVERGLLTPSNIGSSNIYIWTFTITLRMWTASPWAPFWGQFWKIKKKILSDFVVVHFFMIFRFFLDFSSFFQRPLLLHPLQKHFQGVDNVDGTPWHLFWDNFEKWKINILFNFFSPFFRFFLFVWFFSPIF